MSQWIHTHTQPTHSETESKRGRGNKKRRRKPQMTDHAQGEVVIEVVSIGRVNTLVCICAVDLHFVFWLVEDLTGGSQTWNHFLCNRHKIAMSKTHKTTLHWRTKTTLQNKTKKHKTKQYHTEPHLTGLYHKHKAILFNILKTTPYKITLYNAHKNMIMYKITVQHTKSHCTTPIKPQCTMHTKL